MRYQILLKTLKVLIYLKRFFWWLGAKSLFVLAKIFSPGWRFIAFIHYKTDYFLKKVAMVTGLNGQLVKRSNLQILIFVALLIVALPQTKLYIKKDANLPGQKTLAYALTPTDEDYVVEEVTANEGSQFDVPITPAWKTGALSPDNFSFSPGSVPEIELGTVVAGGSALAKPIIFPGQFADGSRDKIIDYIVESGDSLGGIAQKFQISIATILWANNLGQNSFLHPGDKLKILPVSGLTHTVKKGDTLKKIAALYGAKAEDIISFNKLKSDGSNLVVGESILVPNGAKQQPKPAVTPRNINQIAAPAGSRQSPSVSGFIWPTAAHVVTQYFTWKHHGVDIAGGSFSTPNYAAKAGVVIKSQCGWNSGYGCVVVIDHGNGLKTLYGHNSRLLVSVGDYVEAGQTVGLMGNTGNVRGVTGIHLHFEVWVNNVRTNPFQFIR
ncbi:MAG TPA: peptidoglycan DD-metalloendopeptidase family protein [Candidatus Udaeobacter sp.]|nr:peptidoglycan DD-metalloendopeptidase family protein [Candidatus Udaeobacter sp.]